MRLFQLSLAAIISTSFLSLTSVVQASPDHQYGYGGVEMEKIPVMSHVSASCHMNRHHRCYHHHLEQTHAWHVCKKYTYEVTPQHRDIGCSVWGAEWMHHSHHVDEYKS